jgi:hypothetical protein
VGFPAGSPQADKDCPLTSGCQHLSHWLCLCVHFLSLHQQTAPFLRQVRALCWKNWLVARRTSKSTLGQLATPVVVVILLVVLQAVSNRVLSQSTPHPQSTPVPRLPRCVQGPGLPPCRTLVYTPDLPAVRDFLDLVAELNGLTPGSDFLPVRHCPTHKRRGRFKLTVLRLRRRPSGSDGGPTVEARFSWGEGEREGGGEGERARA